MKTHGYEENNTTIVQRLSNAALQQFVANSELKNMLERVFSQTQLCQLRCLMTILDNYMFRPLLAIFRSSLRELKVLLYNVRARDGEISTSGLRNS